MKRFFIICLSLVLTVIVYAQSSGGQITRKKPNITSTTSTSKKTNSRAKTNTTRKPVSSGQTDRASGEVSANNGSVGEYTGMTQAQKDRIIQNFISNMVYVEGGAFMIGNKSMFDSAIHITLSSFYIGKYEVTQEEWEAVMGSNPSTFKGAKWPVESVSWEDCQTFIRKLNTITGKQFRLPTEAEWEYAAGGGHQSIGYKFSGSDNIDDVAWYESNSRGATHKVGLKRPNELGLYDMSGNVWEWCQDWYGNYSNSVQSNPNGPSSGVNRVRRGGSWLAGDELCCVSYRSDYTPLKGRYFLGFRLALSQENQQEQARIEQAHREQVQAIVQHLIGNMVEIQGGTFEMGSNSGDEAPTHQVTLSSFSIGRYEVTQEEWKAVMDYNPSNFKGFNRPVERVSWEACQTFIRKLNAITGKQFRLPTEAEWEYAARGGNLSRGYKYSGSNNIEEVAWYDKNSGMMTHDVGLKLPNELGLYDMSGNVWEWCQDWEGRYKRKSQKNPTGPSSGTERVKRGGCWAHPGWNCTFTRRLGITPNSGMDYLGFRLAL